MQLLLNFIKEKRFMIFLNIGFVLIFFVVFALYQLPLEAVMYPTIMCALLLIIVFSIRFVKYQTRQKQLLVAKENLENVQELLPVPESEEARRYQDLIVEVTRNQIETERLEEEKYQQLKEYYTIWVHQIKTPIASMKLTLQNSDTKESRRLSTELLRIEQYVEMVLAYIKMKENSSDYIIKEYHLDFLIKQSVKRFSTEFIYKKIQLIYEPIHTTILTDEKWFVFVLEQILSNALKYTSSGYVKIYEKAGVLYIEDSGIGIAKEDLPRVFEHGYTGSLGRSDKRASGIGLYLCRVICKKLNHEISVEATLGKGTKIIIHTPSYMPSIE